MLLIVCAMPAKAADSPKRPPNIIFILADDLGWRELGSYGNTFNETPHLDAMARNGLRFTQAYAAAPTCSPTRAAFVTGKAPARVRITDYLGPKVLDKFLAPDERTINEALKQAGYVTGLVGKWHLTGVYELGRGEPAKHGWDQVIASETTYVGPGAYYPPYKHIEHLKPLPGKEYLTDRLNHEAVQFIRRHHDQPFFLYLSHYAPHTRLKGKPELVEKYRNKPGAGDPGPRSETRDRNNPELAAMLESIDEGVGQIMAELDRHGLTDDTLIIFTSDNGGEAVRAEGLGVTSVKPLRAGKSHLYEGGIRVSLLMQWPGVIEAGGVCDVPVITTDFYPTFLDATPAETAPGQIFDGRSLWPLMRDPQTKWEPRTLYWHYPLHEPHFLGGRSCGAIRDGDWKLIEFFDTGELELYNLADDIGETKNLAKQMPDRVKQLHVKLKAWRDGVDAEMY